MSTKEKIMECAEQLFMQQGYELTSIQNIIDHVGIAKGTFYYYYQSKEELVEAIADRNAQFASQQFFQIISDHTGTALEKINLFFEMMTQWKATQIDLLTTVLQVLYSDNNHLYLKKMKEKNIEYYSPILELIIKQGAEEGLFNIPYPAGMGEMLIHVSNSFSDSLAQMLLTIETYPNPNIVLENKMSLYISSMERLLGVKKGSINVVNMKVIYDFIDYLKGKEKQND